MDERDKRNIAIQKKRLDAAEERVTSSEEALQGAEERHARQLQRAADLGIKIQNPPGSESDAPAGSTSTSRPDSAGSYEELTADNEAWAESHGFDDITLDDVLTPAELDELERFNQKGREPWDQSDFLTVGTCALLGLLAALFDDQLDATVKMGLRGLGNTGPLKHIEASGKNLSIDYTGKHFGGPGHRMRSAGHDIGRPWEALQQVRTGEFTGIRWEHGVRRNIVIPGYSPHSVPEALLLWVCHLGADVVTPMSLPLPWWSKLYECSNPTLRKMAANLYDPPVAGSPGVNLRSMLITKSLPVVANEAIIRTKVHIDAYVRDESVKLSTNGQLKRDEMLLATHAATGAAALGMTALELYTTGNVLAVRHVNLPALGRAGFLGLKVAREHRRRLEAGGSPTWDELLRTSLPEPWELAELGEL